MKLSTFFFLIFLVSTIILGTKLYFRFTSKNLTFKEAPEVVVSTEDATSVPSGIGIPSASIWLPLVPSQIDKNVWQTTSKGVSYWKSGVKPGNSGNAILYGHNWTSLLGNLNHVKPGDLIEIYYTNNTKRIFTVKFTQEVDPDNFSILKNTTDTRITLYTCSGFLDSKRFVVVATS